jgi:hypothetical protein
MKHGLIVPAIALGLGGCTGLPMPPTDVPPFLEAVDAWARYLCAYAPTVEFMIDIVDREGRTADAQAIARAICDVVTTRAPDVVEGVPVEGGALVP